MNVRIVTTLCRAAILIIMLVIPILNTAALAGELAGATLSDTLKSGEMTLKLNGLGLRKKSMFKVYVCGSTSNRPRRTQARSWRPTRRKPSACISCATSRRRSSWRP